MPFTGEIAELTIGQTGLTGTKNPATVNVEALLTAQNLSYSEGTLQKEPGTAKYNSSAIASTPSILGGHDWHPVDGTQRMVVVTSTGNLLKDAGTGDFATTLASSLTVTPDVVPQFIEGGKEAAANNRKLFIFTGLNAVQVLSGDGATTSALATPPSDWSGGNQPRVGTIHEGRLWGAGNTNDPHRLYYSITTDHEDLTGSGSGTLAIYPGEGLGIVGIYSFRSGLAVFKHPRGIYFVDTSDPSVANWKVTKITDQIGTAWIGTSAAVENDVYFLDIAGNVRTLQTTDEFGDVSSTSVSDIHDMDPFIRDNLNFEHVRKWHMIYYTTKREVHIAVTGTGATTNNSRLVVDLNRRDLPRFRFSSFDTPVSLWTRLVDNVPELTGGANDGFVRRMDQSIRSHDGTGIPSVFQSPHWDLAHIDPQLGILRKNGAFLELVLEPKGTWNLSVDILWDGAIHETIQFNMGTTGASLGSFVLGTSKLTEEGLVNHKKRITGGGRRFGLIGSNSGDTQDFSLGRFYLHFHRGDEALR